MDSFYCIFCAKEVTSRQEALVYHGCDRWQHRRCQTGITREQHRAAVRSGEEVIWRCLYCSDNSTDHSLPVAESTRLEETDNFNIPLPQGNQDKNRTHTQMKTSLFQILDNEDSYLDVENISSKL